MARIGLLRAKNREKDRRREIKSVPGFFFCPGDSKVARRRNIIYNIKQRDFINRSCLRTKEPGTQPLRALRSERVQRGVRSWGQREIHEAKQENSGDITADREEMTGGGEVVYVHPGASL